MGAARSALRRSLRGPVQMQRQIDKVLDGQPSLAPKHETTKDLLDSAKQENQARFDLHNKRSEEYLQLLKQIRVDSVKVPDKNNPQPEEESLSPTTATTRLSTEELTLLFQQRMKTPDEWTAEKIASHFKLSTNSVENLLKYYSDFTVHVAPKIPEPLEEITH
ncbi:NADH dehydrogenase [ubiquinone] 1 alpha subcomplex assembly factor 4-like isoform X1 [Dendronephthya gigantea]|uniref:NADH dehydrogenase [ubiquinone] 1 alpha subcomplex assembly factor 4-like isoform X1 n=1 Tax=Dendronephthya gigantea TaxID=151771 RepID=UPI00106B598B|nr:NADH dehydrogenase [ubiquinone] 1 alpha subcomplex assembly factor 4-like isoform X1 [Dendronephthya gigantea]